MLNDIKFNKLDTYLKYFIKCQVVFIKYFKAINQQKESLGTYYKIHQTRELSNLPKEKKEKEKHNKHTSLYP